MPVGEPFPPTGTTPRDLHSLYRARNRNRGDVEVLRRLHAAIGDYLTASAEESRPSREVFMEPGP